MCSPSASSMSGVVRSGERYPNARRFSGSIRLDSDAVVDASRLRFCKLFFRAHDRDRISERVRSV